MVGIGAGVLCARDKNLVFTGMALEPGIQALLVEDNAR
jgi:hypothetical protein